MVIGSLAVNIVANVSKFTSSLNKAQTSLGRFVKSIGPLRAALAGLSAAAVVSSLKRTADHIERIGDTAGRLGMSAQELAGLAHGAEQSGIAFDQLVKAITQLQKNAGHSNLIRVAEQLAKIPNTADRTAAALKLMGRGGAELLPFLMQGPEQIRQLQEEFNKFGPVLTAEAIQKVDQANDAMGRFNIALEAVKTSIVVGLAPSIQSLAEMLASLNQEGTFGDKLANAFAMVGDVVHTLKIGFAKLQEVFLRTLAVLAGAADSFIKDLIHNLNRLPGVNIRTASGANIQGTVLGLASQEFDRSADEARKRFEGLLIGETPSERLAAARSRLATAGAAPVGRAPVDSSQAESLRNSLLGILPGSMQASLTGGKLNPQVEGFFKGIGGLIAQGAGVVTGGINVAAGLAGLPGSPRERQPKLEALIGGSREAFIASRENLRPRHKQNDPNEKTADNTKEAVKVLKGIHEGIKSMAMDATEFIGGAIGG